MPNPNMYVTVKRVNPERLQCPVKDCQAEGKEENRVDTPFISGLGPMTVYLCDAHAAVLAVMFLDKNTEADVIWWDEPRELARQKKSMPSPAPGQGLDPLFQAIWQVIKDWDINVPEYYEGYCGANASHVMLLWNALSQASTKDQLPGEAGALYAFMGWLTTRDEVSGPFSRSHDTSGSGSLVKQFIDMQGWPDPPDGWHHCIKPFEEEEKEALGRAHMEYHKLARARIENYNQRVPDPVTKITWTGAMPLGTTSDTGYELEDISYGHAPIEEV